MQENTNDERPVGESHSKISVESITIREETHQRYSCRRNGRSLWKKLAVVGSGSARLSERATGAWNKYDA